MRLTRKRMRDEDEKEEKKYNKQDRKERSKKEADDSVKKNKQNKSKADKKKEEIIIIDSESDDDDEDKVAWIESDVKALWRGCTLEAGSNVIVKVEDGSSQFAIIESLWKSKTGENMAEFRWYYSLNDLPRALRQKSEQGGSGIAPFHPNEILETDHVDENPIESIELVTDNIIFLDNPSNFREMSENFLKTHIRLSDEKGNELYFYNRFYSTSTGIIRPSIHHRPGIYSRRMKVGGQSSDQYGKDKELDSFESQILAACN